MKTATIFFALFMLVSAVVGIVEDKQEILGQDQEQTVSDAEFSEGEESEFDEEAVEDMDEASFGVLKMGNNNRAVKALQYLLREKGYLSISSPTTYFGSMTDSAVKSFQRANGLTVDGVAGSGTLGKLISAAARSSIKSDTNRALQCLLQISEDGAFGPGTERVLKSATGSSTAGSTEWAKLFSKFAGSSSSSPSTPSTPSEPAQPNCGSPRNSPDTCKVTTSDRKATQAGVDFIKSFEGLIMSGDRTCMVTCPRGQACLYRDPVGYPTIGYGYLMKKGDTYKCWTKETATAHFATDLERYEKPVASFLNGLKLTDPQFDALVSFAYNVGPGIITRSKYGLSRALKAGRYSDVCRELNKYVKARGRTLRGLVRRRAAECEAFQ
eukprot:TRINITY_DN5898_c0_g1_i1.p1 TRINITY_DN5898_c0_g1~~TRINITY_DN5898_c0_g1_i1.p1  ORF type:complete len:403 (+),score=120.90 TRINITY_DN5898_c0_g1_i1:62-1210(+)